LIEMDWGRYEGRTLVELRAEPGFADTEGQGLDFRPLGGESPRDVQDRLRPWLARLAADPAPAIAVAHRGVIRALYALATGWDMKRRAPLARPHAFAHLYDLAPSGVLTVGELNIPLLAPDEPDPYDPPDG
jgi:probable phosphoglycerate mutase